MKQTVVIMFLILFFVSCRTDKYDVLDINNKILENINNSIRSGIDFKYDSVNIYLDSVQYWKGYRDGIENK